MYQNSSSFRAVSAIPFSLFFPVIPWLMQLILFAWFVSVLAYPLPFEIYFLKLINDSSILNKGNLDRDGVQISDLNQHRFLRFRFSVFSLDFRLRRYIKHSRQCFIGYPNTSNFVKNTPLRVVFSTLLSVFGYPDETLSLVFDILRDASARESGQFDHLLS